MSFDITMVIGALILGGAMRFEIVYFGTLVGMFTAGPIMAPTMTKIEGQSRSWITNKSNRISSTSWGGDSPACFLIILTFQICGKVTFSCFEIVFPRNVI